MTIQNTWIDRAPNRDDLRPRGQGHAQVCAGTVSPKLMKINEHAATTIPANWYLCACVRASGS